MMTSCCGYLGPKFYCRGSPCSARASKSRWHSSSPVGCVLVQAGNCCHAVGRFSSNKVAAQTPKSGRARLMRHLAILCLRLLARSRRSRCSYGHCVPVRRPLSSLIFLISSWYCCRCRAGRCSCWCGPGNHGPWRSFGTSTHIHCLSSSSFAGFHPWYPVEHAPEPAGTSLGSRASAQSVTPDLTTRSRAHSVLHPDH